MEPSPRSWGKSPSPNHPCVVELAQSLQGGNGLVGATRMAKSLKAASEHSGPPPRAHALQISTDRFSERNTKPQECGRDQLVSLAHRRRAAASRYRTSRCAHRRCWPQGCRHATRDRRNRTRTRQQQEGRLLASRVTPRNTART